MKNFDITDTHLPFYYPVYAYGGAYYDDEGNIHYDDGGEYKKGGIYIKPENRGKFNATKKRTGKSTEELTHSSNPVTRKRAIFAQNAAKWHHEYGGDVYQEGGEEQVEVPEVAESQEDPIVAQVTEALASGANPHEVIKQLIQGGVDRNEAVAMVRDILSQGQQQTQVAEYGGSYDDGGMYPYGGSYNRGYPYKTAALSATLPNAKMFKPLKYGLAGIGALEGILGAGLGYTQAFSGGKNNRLSEGIAGSMDALMGYERPQKNSYEQYFQQMGKEAESMPKTVGYNPTSSDKMFDQYGQVPANDMWTKYGQPKHPYEKYLNQPATPPSRFGTPPTSRFTPLAGPPAYNQQGAPELWNEYGRSRNKYDQYMQYGGIPPLMQYPQPLTGRDLMRQSREDIAPFMGDEYNNELINKYPTRTEPVNIEALSTDVAHQRYLKENPNAQIIAGTNTNKFIGDRNYYDKAWQAIGGFGMANQNLADIEDMDQNEYNRWKRRNGNINSSNVINANNPYGNYLQNPGVADWYQPGQHVAVQDYGTTRTAKCGGTMKYKAGGEYQVSEEELLQLMQNGAEVEFL